MKNVKKLSGLAGILLVCGMTLPANAETVVKTLTLNVNQEVNNSYAPTAYEFDGATVLSSLGCTELIQATVVSLDSDGNVLDQTANNGYWYNNDGEVCYWGDDAAWFIENYGDNSWNVGNMPGLGALNSNCNIGFAYEGKAVIFDVIINLTIPAPVKPNVLKTYNLDFSNKVTNDFESALCPFNADEVIKELGCTELTTEMLVSLDKDGYTIANHTATAGYFYNFDGEVCGYGENAAWFIEYYGYDIEYPEDATNFYIGNMAGVYDAYGKCNIGFAYNGNVVMFDITVTLGDGENENPNPEPETVDVVKTYTLSFENAVSEDYQVAPCVFQAEEVMKLLGCSELTTNMLISLDEDGNIIENHTANAGYFYNFDSEVCYWGDDAAWFIEYEEGDAFYIGNMAGVFEADGKCNIGFAYDGKAVMFDITVKLTKAETTPSPSEVDVVKTYTLSFENAVSEDYQTAPCVFQAEEVMKLLGCSELTSKMLISLGEDGELITKQTANAGYYYNFDGEVCMWGDDAAWFIEYYGEDEDDPETATSFYIGNMAGVFEADGKCNIGFAYDGKAVMFDITVKLTEEETEAPEAVEVVKTYKLQYVGMPQADYVPGQLEFNSTEVLTLLGISTLNDAEVISLNEEDEVLAQTGNNGYWYDADGEVCKWGADAVWFVEYHEANAWSIGNYPGVTNANGTCNIGFAYEDKAVMFEITVVLNEETVGINSIQTSNEEVNIYNLQGVKVAKDLNSLSNGIYIINGKKVLVRK